MAKKWRKVRGFIETDVLTEAKKRIHHIYDQFDTVAVSFSGGKDSLAALHLTYEVALERQGPDAKVNVYFYDEEVIPDSVINFVHEYAELPWINFTWYCLPMRSTKYSLGESRPYVQWDPNREWVRPLPDGAVTPETLGWTHPAPIDQYQMNSVIASHYPGRVAVINGIRASESLVRFRSSLNKISENYINATGNVDVSFCKPLFDWQERDIFRYFYDRGIKYCPIYDKRMYAGVDLRVATPLIAESAKQFHRLAAIEPVFYEQVVRIFPEMILQERYGQELQKTPMPESMYESWDSLITWINENITDRREAALARTRVRGVQKRAKDPSRVDSYPVEYVARQIYNGQYKREIMPLDHAAQASYKKRAEKRAAR